MTVFIIVFLTALASLFAGTFGSGKWSRYFGIFGLLIALYVSYLPECSFFDQYKNMFEFGANAALFTKISIVTTIFIFIIAGFAFSNHRSHQSELYALMLFSLCGGVILFSYQNLVTLFLGVEILSIPLYVLAGANKTDLRSTEASMKYLLMGAFATGFLLFGVAMVYGTTGSFDLYKIHEFSTSAEGNLMFKLGAIMMLVALAFKVSLAPFHMWSPDVYQGAPSLISVFMMTVVKISAFFGFFRLMTIAFVGIIPDWIQVIGVLVIITLLLANAMGLAQSNAKKMLAYSSVSHAGYIALIFFGITNASIYNLAFYLFAYAIATVGMFMSLIWVEKLKRETSFMAFKGLSKNEPLISVVAAISLMSMAGVPLTAGFIGKFGIFSQAIVTNPMIVIIAILGSAISIAYYLRPIIAMFFYKESSFNTTEKVSFTYNAVAVVLIATMIGLGVYPDLFKMIFSL